MERICIFGRVSTNVQDYERQVNELTALALRNNWSVEAVFCEKISGAKKNTERKELSRMVKYVQAHNINKVMVSELSRLGRDTLQVLEVIEQFNKLGISLYIQNYGIETLTENGEVNPMSQFLITILAEVARIEGYRKSETDMREQYAEVIRLLRKGISLRNISKITGTSVNTIRKCQALI